MSGSEDESKAEVDVGNPLNQLDDPASAVARAARAGSGASRDMLDTRVQL